ncbi:hypothetical protein D3C76_1419850 [compost metagenome]
MFQTDLLDEICWRGAVMAEGFVQRAAGHAQGMGKVCRRVAMLVQMLFHQFPDAFQTSPASGRGEGGALDLFEQKAEYQIHHVLHHQ